MKVYNSLKTAVTIFLFFLCSTFSQAAEIPRAELTKVLSAQTMTKLENFLNFSTKEAQDLLPKFSDEEIVTIWDVYRGSKSLSEQRIFWLLQAHLERKADAMAAQRLFYLSAALIILSSLFFVFVLLIYYRQKKFLQNFEK